MTSLPSTKNSIDGGTALIDTVEIVLRNRATGSKLPVYLDVFDNSLAHKWLHALDLVLEQGLHLEKNYCFFGFARGERNAALICKQINSSIMTINSSDIGYAIQDHFSPGTLMDREFALDQSRMNRLHRYFEDLQGTSQQLSVFYQRASAEIRWHIRQLNLLCHELESWALSYRKSHHAPEWCRPSQLMCWINAPRFEIDNEDLKLFGIDTLYRPLGGVFVGVNKAIGKHHWEVFKDEGRDSRIDELTTGHLRAQTEAAADFDIEWARDTRGQEFMDRDIRDFTHWLQQNGFNPTDPSLTIGHPRCGQVDLMRSFGSDDYQQIWSQLDQHQDVWSVSTSRAGQEYPYHWSDCDFMQLQIQALERNNHAMV